MADLQGSIDAAVLQLPREGAEGLLYGAVGGAHVGGVSQLVLPHNGIGGVDDSTVVGAAEPVELSLQDFQSSGDAGTNSGSDDGNSSREPGESAAGGPEENDTRRARRILANRRSAQRSRTRRMQYIHEIERKVSGGVGGVFLGLGWDERGWDGGLGSGREATCHAPVGARCCQNDVPKREFRSKADRRRGVHAVVPREKCGLWWLASLPLCLRSFGSQSLLWCPSRRFGTDGNDRWGDVSRSRCLPRTHATGTSSLGRTGSLAGMADRRGELSYPTSA